MLEEFMTNQSWPKATKFRDNKNNGWTFEPLAESRVQWDRRYSPQKWNDVGIGMSSGIRSLTDCRCSVAVGYFNGENFAERLERAINRSDRAKLIEARAERVEDR
jgi:hypothetical protein